MTPATAAVIIGGTPPKVHLDHDGLSRCGKTGLPLTADKTAVTCLTCLNISDGTHGHGNRQTDSFHGTAARYRWHLRHEGKPVTCRRCLKAESRRAEDSPGRQARNARRRERYAAARAAGLTARQASQRKDLRRAA